MYAIPFLDLPPLRSAGGTVTLPGSKSISNRVLLLAALSAGETTVHDLLDSDDTRVMLTGLAQLGCGIERLDEHTPSKCAAWAVRCLCARRRCSWATRAPPCAP